MMSAASSMPTDTRTTSGPAPAAIFWSSASWRCVVEAGWMTSERVVADVGEMREELEPLHERYAGLVSAREGRT